MKNNHTLLRTVLWALPLIVMLAGCGNESDSPFANAFSNSSLFSGNVNNGLTGRIYVSDSGLYHDLRSGRTVEVGGSWLTPSKDGLEYVSVEEDFEVRRDQSKCFYSQAYDRVSIYDAASGAVNDSFALPADIWNVSLSPDRQWIGAYYKDDTVCFSYETQFTIFSRTGEVIFRAKPDFIQSFDWLPDNRLVISRNGGISVEESAGTLFFNRIVDLNGIAGNPSRLSVDSTGTRILFEMVTGASNFLQTVKNRDATVWSVNIDGSDLRERVTSTNALQADSNSEPRVNAPPGLPMATGFL